MMEDNYIFRSPLACYAAVSKSKQADMSSSGGVSYELANHIIDAGGGVFGAAYSADFLRVEHIWVDNKDDLSRIQGSKYIKSNLNSSYHLAVEQLKSGKKVLFTGTPCQIAGLYRFIPNDVDTSGLYTMDVICHGTPSGKLYYDYIRYINKSNADLDFFRFRNKNKFGSKMAGEYKFKGGRVKRLYMPESSYYKLFISGLTYTDNCYSCKFARRERVSDITVGDFVGIGHETLKALGKKCKNYKKGISCVMLNTQKGLELFENIKDMMVIHPVQYEEVYRGNGQLNHPTKCNESQRKELFDLYNQMGYEGIEKYFKEHSDYHMYILRITLLIPRWAREGIKRVCRMNRKGLFQ